MPHTEATHLRILFNERQTLLCQEIDPSLPSNAEDDGFDNLATALLDTKLLEAVQLVNMDLQQETRQVVLVGCGLDTRPHRHVDTVPPVCISCGLCLHTLYIKVSVLCERLQHFNIVKSLECLWLIPLTRSMPTMHTHQL